MPREAQVHIRKWHTRASAMTGDGSMQNRKREREREREREKESERAKWQEMPFAAKRSPRRESFRSRD
jgi:hypothetical protein